MCYGTRPMSVNDQPYGILLNVSMCYGICCANLFKLDSLCLCLIIIIVDQLRFGLNHQTTMT